MAESRKSGFAAFARFSQEKTDRWRQLQGGGPLGFGERDRGISDIGFDYKVERNYRYFVLDWWVEIT
jgi:hypothetical protein